MPLTIRSAGRLLLPLLYATFALSAQFSTFSAPVIGISDGDTIRVLHNGRSERVRLFGIDCPEAKQPFGTRAKQFTGDLVFGVEVTVVVRDYDRYKRTVAEIILPDGRNLNHEVVRAGLAWWFVRYARRDQDLPGLEIEAREARRGLWVDAEPTAPWLWRNPPATSTKQR